MRQPWWEWGLWQYRNVFTQTNAGGGAIVVDVVPVAGMSMLVVHVLGVNSATNTIDIVKVDEDNNQAIRFADIASGAGTSAAVPQSNSQAVASTRVIDSTPMETRIFRSDDKLSIFQSAAGNQNDTLELVIRAFLSSAERPIVTKARSTNPGDVTTGTPTVDRIR